MGYPRYDSYFINQKNKELKIKILKRNHAILKNLQFYGFVLLVVFSQQF